MNLTQVTEFVFNRKVSHSDEDVVVDLVVVGVDFKDSIHCYFIKNWKHECGLFSKPDSESRLLIRQMAEVDFNTLLIVFTHVVNS